MSVKEVLRKLRIGKRTFDRWIAAGCVERPVRGECSASVIVDGKIAKHLSKLRWPLERIAGAREQGRLFLGLGPGLCLLFPEVLESGTRDWLLAYMKLKAGVALDKPQKLWIRWNEDKDELEFIAGGPVYVCHEKGGRMAIERVMSGPQTPEGTAERDASPTASPPPDWEKSEEIRIERKIHVQRETKTGK